MGMKVLYCCSSAAAGETDNKCNDSCILNPILIPTLVPTPYSSGLRLSGDDAMTIKYIIFCIFRSLVR